MYQFKVIYQNKETGAYFTPLLIAFNKRDLNTQIINKRPDGYRYIRTVRTLPGSRTDLYVIMPV